MHRFALSLGVIAVFFGCGGSERSAELPRHEAVASPEPAPARPARPKLDLTAVPAAEEVKPNACGDYAASEQGARLKKFFVAGIALRDAIHDTRNYVGDTCRMMARELGIEASGETQELCRQTLESFRTGVDTAFAPDAGFEIMVIPPNCAVSAALRARATGECEGSAVATEISDACRAHGAVTAGLAAECRIPTMHVEVEREQVLVPAAVAPLRRAVGVAVPRAVMAHRKLSVPLQSAFEAWADVAHILAREPAKAATGTGEEARCVVSQLRAAAVLADDLSASLQASTAASLAIQKSAGLAL